MTSISQQASAGGALESVARFVDRVERIVQAAAAPSFVQLLLRFALAVPFWKSGILKWDGFLRLSDTAVTLFTDEFMLHLPGGPLSISGADGHGVPFRLRGDQFPDPSRVRFGDALRRAGPPVHDSHRRADRSRRMACAYYLGGDGARHHCLGAGSPVIRLSDPPRFWIADAVGLVVPGCRRPHAA